MYNWLIYFFGFVPSDPSGGAARGSILLSLPASTFASFVSLCLSLPSLLRQMQKPNGSSRQRALSLAKECRSFAKPSSCGCDADGAKNKSAITTELWRDWLEQVVVNKLTHKRLVVVEPNKQIRPDAKLKKKKKRFPMNLHISRELEVEAPPTPLQSSCATAVVLLMIMFYCQLWQISDGQLITTIYETNKKLSDLLSVRVSRCHAEAFPQKNNTTGLQRKRWDLLDMMNTKQSRGRAVFPFIHQSPTTRPAGKISKQWHMLGGGGASLFWRSESGENSDVLSVPQTNIAALFSLLFSLVNCQRPSPPPPTATLHHHRL